MINYEIWGPNQDGEEIRLGEESGEVPSVDDTIEIDGKTRKVKSVKSHHSNGDTVRRVYVGQSGYEEPMPIAV